ncbi:MAG: hypothetical protein SPE06_02885 [[Actinobacillus] rossii]|nr:hypothetical protein [[Actinobacillus] rossii]MDY4505350.1 hypothetical protein [[Actinobacillus] rossii]
MRRFVKLNFFQVMNTGKGFYLTRSFDYVINTDKIVTLDSCLLSEYYTEKPNTFNFGDSSINKKGNEKEYPIIVFEPEYFKQFIETTGVYNHCFLRDELQFCRDQSSPKLVATCNFSELERLIAIDLTN